MILPKPTMAARPTATPGPGPGASVTVTVPPEWFISISAVSRSPGSFLYLKFTKVLHPNQISRKTYDQAVFVKTNIRNSSSTFKSDAGTSGPMPDAVSGSTTFPIAPRQTQVNLEIWAYYSETPKTARAIKDAQYASTKVDIHSVCLFLYYKSRSRT